MMLLHDIVKLRKIYSDEATIIYHFKLRSINLSSIYNETDIFHLFVVVHVRQEWTEWRYFMTLYDSAYMYMCHKNMYKV